MADTDKPKEGRPESPTTARELDFDDDELPSHPQTPAKDVTHASTVAGGSSGTPSTKPASTTTTTTAATTAPTPASKPLSPREQAELTLQEAFPSIEASVVKAVLAASGGHVEPAFNALLGMTDPDSAAQNEQAQQQARLQQQQQQQQQQRRVREVQPSPPPPQPPRPVVAGPGRSQLEADELYARQLAEHYERQDARAMSRQQQQQRGGTFAGQPTRPYHDEEERERNFIDDDLPEIGENIRKGFLETQQKFSGWFNTLKKRMDGEDDDEPPQLPARRQQSAGAPRRSHDYERYDADPEEFGNDFSKLQLRDDTAPGPKQPRRANPDLFKPTPATPQEGSGRRVSFQDGPPEEIGAAATEPAKTQSKASKWQPLSTVEPSPVAEHDPFSLGDSDDDEAKKKAAGEKKDVKDVKDAKDDKTEESNLLAKATAEAMAGEIGDDEPSGKLELKDNTK